MKRRAVTLGRASQIKSARQAVAWAALFHKSSPHYKRIGGSLVVHHVAPNLFTTRPSNLLSVHGHDRFKLPVEPVYNGKTVMRYLRDHWCRRAAIGEKVIGLKLVLCINPTMLDCTCRVDLDHLLVHTAESTFVDIGREWFGEGNMDFVLGIHHGINRFEDPWFVKRQRASGKPVKTTLRARSHLHILLLPKTDRPDHRSIIESVVTRFEGHLVNALRDLSVHGLLVGKPALTTRMEALLREASLSVCETSYPGEDSPWGGKASTESARVVADFKAQVEALRDPNIAGVRYQNRKEQAHKYASMVGSQVRSKALRRRLEIGRGIDLWGKQQLSRMQQIVSAFGHLPGHLSINLYDFPCKRVLLASGLGRASLRPNQVEDLDRQFEELHRLRKSFQIHGAAFQTLIDMMVAPRMDPPKELPWINTLNGLRLAPKSER